MKLFSQNHLHSFLHTLLTTASLPSLTLPDSDVRSVSPAETGETGSFHTPDILDTSSEIRDEPDFSAVVCTTLCLVSFPECKDAVWE